MSRIESRSNPPPHIGNIRTSPAKAGKKCSRCREPAKQTLRNAYRSSDICDSRECREREEIWVGNMPHEPRSSAKTWTTDRKVVERSFKVRSEEGIEFQKTRATRTVLKHAR